MTDAVNEHMCIICDDEGTMRCGRCKDARYCSVECQRADWRTHKMLCKYNAAFATSRRPSPSHVRAIIFSEREDFPRFVWIYSGLTSFENAPFDNPALAYNFSPLVKDGEKATADSVIIGNGLSRRALNPHLVVCRTQSPTSTETMSLRKIDPRISKAFIGSFVFLGETEHALYPVATDLTTSHLRYAIDELAIRSDIQRRAFNGCTDSLAEKRTGVVVNSVGDTQTFVWKKYQRFDFNPTGEYAAGFAAPAAIDLPLRIYKIQQSVSGIGRTWKIKPETSQDGSEICHLPHNFNHIHMWLTNPVKSSWLRLGPATGTNPIEWRDHYQQGSFLVARVDGKPLYPVHLEAMYWYFYNRLVEYSKETVQHVVLPSGQVSLSLSEAAFIGGPWANKLSRDDFKAWYEEFVREERTQKWYPHAKETLSPYAL